jgi:two-component system, LytTR family, sensor kinase
MKRTKSQPGAAETLHHSPVMSGQTTSWYPLGRRELLVIFAFWMAIATLSVFDRFIDPRGMGFRSGPAAPVIFAFVESTLWALLTPLIFWLVSRFNRLNWVLRIVLLVAVGFVIAYGVSMALAYTREAIYPMASRRMMRSPFAFGRLRFPHQLLVYLAIVATGFARQYFLRDQTNQRQSVELQRQLADARLEALRMQINPHFLFNTLHAISALVERDPSGVRRMIARLSELLRHTIDSRGSSEVRLHEELGFLQRYIEIMEIRFQGRLEVVKAIDDEALEALVPNLILQPIVENALEHGVSRRASGGRVEISACRSGELLEITVRDNGPGITEIEAGGVGLANTRERLRQLYGTEGEVSVASAADGGAVATITLPFHTTERAGG